MYHPLDTPQIRVNDDETVSLWPADLPGIADPDAFEIRLDRASLFDLLHRLDARDLGLDADRTGGL